MACNLSLYAISPFQPSLRYYNRFYASNRNELFRLTSFPYFIVRTFVDLFYVIPFVHFQHFSVSPNMIQYNPIFDYRSIRLDFSAQGLVVSVGVWSAKKVGGSSITLPGDRVKRTSRRLKNHPIDKAI